MLTRISERKLWLSALLWATALAALFVLVNYFVEPCFFFVNGETVILLRFGLLWLWVFCFVLFRPTARIALIAGTICAVLFNPFIESSFQPAVQSHTVKALREMHVQIEGYKQMNGGSYPRSVPPLVSSDSTHKYYSFTYVPRASKPSGELTSYQVVAVPVRRECGFYRSFTLTGDGTIHHTVEPRAATAEDPPI
jgi:hypothetical protein